MQFKLGSYASMRPGPRSRYIFMLEKSKLESRGESAICSRAALHSEKLWQPATDETTGKTMVQYTAPLFYSPIENFHADRVCVQYSE